MADFFFPESGAEIIFSSDSVFILGQGSTGRKSFMPYQRSYLVCDCTLHFFPQTYAQETFKVVTVLPLDSRDFPLHPGNNFRDISWIRQ